MKSFPGVVERQALHASQAAWVGGEAFAFLRDAVKTGDGGSQRQSLSDLWRNLPIAEVGAAPHCPAGHFSPYSDGEKEAGRNAGALSAMLTIGESGDDSAPLPVTIRGEGAGRQVRGGAGLENSASRRFAQPRQLKGYSRRLAS